MMLEEEKFHSETAKKCFNAAWDYLDKKARDSSDDLQMLSLAHASRYHWNIIGQPRNLAISDWQVSRIYAVLQQPQLSLRYAESSLETCQKNNLKDLLVSAYEGMARAYAIAEKRDVALSYIKKAYDQLNKSTIADDDRKIYADQILETEAMITR